MGEAQPGERIAQCGCGRVQVRVGGEPRFVGACHCDFCNTAVSCRTLPSGALGATQGASIAVAR
jgi:hypothetical protein